MLNFHSEHMPADMGHMFLIAVLIASARSVMLRASYYDFVRHMMRAMNIHPEGPVRSDWKEIP
jgi:hypothetical protein